MADKVYPDDLTDAQRTILLKYGFKAENLDDLTKTWYDRGEEEKDETGLTGAQVVETKIGIIKDFNTNTPFPYGEVRKKHYPDIGDQLDDLYHKGAFSDTMAAQLKAVKDANPKS